MKNYFANGCIVVFFCLVFGCTSPMSPPPATPAWPHARFAELDLCTLSSVNDALVYASLTEVGSPVEREVSLWPGQKLWWTPLKFTILRSVRGEHQAGATGTALVNAQISDRTLQGLKLPLGAKTGAWLFLKTLGAGEFWLGADSVGVPSEKELTFVGASFESEGRLLGAFEAASGQPGCGYRQRSRLDQDLTK